MLTLFTIPKPFAGHIGLIQRNAIASWTLLPGVRGSSALILLGAALALLVWSFALDVRWLQRQHARRAV